MSDPLGQLNAQAFERSEHTKRFKLAHILIDRARERRERIEGRSERKERTPARVDERYEFCLRELPEELRGVLMERGRRREL